MSLEGFIFTCNMETLKECVERKVFGLPSGRQAEVNRISPCTPLFLFNYTTKELICGFEADGYGKKDVSREAFGGRFPAQVKVRILQPGLPRLNPDQYGPVVFEDVQRRRLRHNLDKSQVTRLLQLAATAPRNPSAFVGRNERPRNGRGTGRKFYGHHSVLTNGAVPVAKRPRLVEPRPMFREGPRPNVDNVEPSCDANRLPVASRYQATGVQGVVDLDRGIEVERGGALVASGYEQERSGAVPTPVVSFGEEIDEKSLTSSAPGQNPRTTVVVHPVPACIECPVATLVDLLDLVCRGRYGFLLVENVEFFGRVLYVDFVSEVDVAKFRAAWAGKSWKELLGKSRVGNDAIKMYFWKECQGLNELTMEFRDLHYLHVGEPYACPKLLDEWPLFFMSNLGAPNPDAKAAGTHSQTKRECPTLRERVLDQFNYQELYDRIKEDCGEEGVVAEKLKEAAWKDLVELSRQRFDSEEFRSHPQYKLFKEVGGLVVEDLMRVSIKSDPHEVEKVDLDFDGDDDGISEVDVFG